ncbi:hypothetical protein J2Y63_006041 [Shinella sp. BE166]|uniref:hypothetical protein n=1 Tax=Shinella sp. BE166 TaxID=3373918 RepID=UPI003EBF5E4F
MRKNAMDSHVVISALPLTEPDRSKFIETANLVFERVVDRIEPDNLQLTRSLWDPDRYVDHHLLSPDMLPISRDYALSLIDAFFHHVIDLAVEADKLMDRPPKLN